MKHKCSHVIPSDITIDAWNDKWFLMENMNGMHTVSQIYFCPYCGNDLRLKPIEDIRSVDDIKSCPLVHKYSGVFGEPYVGLDGCYGYAQGPGDDEPCEGCKGCRINNSYEGDDK